MLKGLQNAGIDAHGLDTRDYSPLQLKSDGFERVFIVLHGRGGEDGSIQGALEFLDIPYTGSRVLGSALAMDKVRTKQIWQALGLPTAPYAVVHRADYLAADAAQLFESLNLCAFVKPSREGSSIGIVKAESAEQLHQAIETAFEHDDEVLVESFIDGPEYTVSIVGDQVLPAIELRTARSFYDYAAKYQSGDTQYICPCELTDDDREELNRLSLRAFESLGCEGWGRVDIMRDANGAFQLLEVNTVPGMTETSLVPKAARVAGYSFEELLLKILEEAH
ncbi:D-alanine--D-alanine ligase [Dongshaea marina]|uniref:D-alanine--D-alanine ligase n=1 Tax=Dongshaea marina TaxID=2047966 RepID=UPI001F1AAD7C|nr:D-alanine--D-alanine ligase [Dongshaea marina]